MFRSHRLCTLVRYGLLSHANMIWTSASSYSDIPVHFHPNTGVQSVSTTVYIESVSSLPTGLDIYEVGGARGVRAEQCANFALRGYQINGFSKYHIAQIVLCPRNTQPDLVMIETRYRSAWLYSIVNDGINYAY